MIVKVTFFYFYCLFSYLFGFRNKHALAFRKLCNTSFNVQEKDRYNLKTILSGIFQVYKRSISLFLVQFGNKQPVYDLGASSEEHRLQYLRSISNQENQYFFISADKCFVFSSTAIKIAFLLITIPVQLSMIVLGLFKKEKSGIAFILSNLLITANVASIMANNKAERITVFSAYDTNNAFLSLYLQKCNIKVSLVTSEVPLYKWNQILICNDLIICSDYQYQEVKHFKDSIVYETIRLGEPENYFKVKELYRESPPLNNTIGFLSTGGWVRNALGHIDQGTDIESKENQILCDLNELLKNDKRLKLVVYPHPRELNYYNGNADELKKRYGTCLKDIQFSINTSEKNSNQLFDENYLSVCYMTTLVFERAYAKRKSAIVYFKEKDFPLDYSSDYLSVIKNKDELSKLLRSTFKLI